MATTRPAELRSGTVTSWLPITTAYTSQSDCNSAAWARDYVDITSQQWPYIYDPAFAQSVKTSLTCFPPEATTWWQGDTTVNSVATVWSMGPVICPAAYRTISTTVIAPSMTSIICCPTDYVFQKYVAGNGGKDGVCTSTLSKGYVLSYALPDTSNLLLATTTLGDAIPIIAVPFEGYNFEAITTSTTSPVTSHSSNSQTATSTSLSSQTDSAKSGLSTGAQAGIGVGVGGAALILIALAAFFLLRRRRRAKAGVSELDGNGVNTGVHKPQELESRVTPAELHG